MKRITIILLLITLLLVSGVVWADDGFDIPWSVMGSGGGHMAGGDFEAFTTIGQPLAGASEGDGYAICLGFQCGAAATATATPTPTVSPTPAIPLYLPLVHN